MDQQKRKDEKDRLDKIIGVNIRAERKARKMQRQELAHTLGLTASHLGLIERGERGATPVTMQRVVNAFGITYDKLFDESIDKSKHDGMGSSEEACRKKVITLLHNLTASQLVVLSYTIKGFNAVADEV